MNREKIEARIIEGYRAGLTPTEIGQPIGMSGVSVGQVARQLRQRGIDIPPGRYSQRPDGEQISADSTPWGASTRTQRVDGIRNGVRWTVYSVDAADARAELERLGCAV